MAQQARWLSKHKPCDMNILKQSGNFKNDHFQKQSVLKLSRTTYSIYFVKKKKNQLAGLCDVDGVCFLGGFG